MVWDLETMERNNREATYNYVERNKDIVDATVTHVLTIVMQQVDLALSTINAETEHILVKVREKLMEELKETSK